MNDRNKAAVATSIMIAPRHGNELAHENAQLLNLYRNEAP